MTAAASACPTTTCRIVDWANQSPAHGTALLVAAGAALLVVLVALVVGLARRR